MSVSTELLNSTYQDFKGPTVNTFSQNVPAISALEKKGKISKEGGSFVERSLMTGSSATGTGIYTGDETLDRTRAKKLGKFRVDFHRIVVPIVIPNKDKVQNQGKKGAVKLLETYVKGAADGVAVDREKYWLTGKSTAFVLPSEELYGSLTLNGQFAAGLGVGVENGYLDFVAPASQTDLVQNVSKSLANFIYNQYGDITGWAIDGVRTLRKVYRACSQFAGKPNSGPDLIVMDDDTYGNYQESKFELLRLMKVSDKTDNGNMVQDVFGLATIYASNLIDLAADFTGVAADGVTYMLNTDWIEIIQLESMELSDFVDAGTDQDGVVSKMSWHEATIFQKPPAHGCISGGAS